VKEQGHPLRWGTHRFFEILYTSLAIFFIAYTDLQGNRLFNKPSLGWKYIRRKMSFNSFRPEMQNVTDQNREKKRTESTDEKEERKERGPSGNRCKKRSKMRRTSGQMKERRRRGK
jgi:hypothetical protein